MFPFKRIRVKQLWRQNILEISLLNKIAVWDKMIRYSIGFQLLFCLHKGEILSKFSLDMYGTLCAMWFNTPLAELFRMEHVALSYILCKWQKTLLKGEIIAFQREIPCYWPQGTFSQCIFLWSIKNFKPILLRYSEIKRAFRSRNGSFLTFWTYL